MNKPTLRPSPTALLNPRCDSSFKALFTQETEASNAALKDFISALLGRGVESVQLLPNEPPVDALDELQMSFDVSAIFDDGERADLEMQSRTQNYDYAVRAEIQAARLLNVSAKKGSIWAAPRVYQISVLNFEWNKADKSPLRWYTMRESNGNELGNRLNVILFDLIKIHGLLGTPPKSLSKLEKWGLFLSYADKAEQQDYIHTLIESEEGIMNASAALYEISEDEKNWYRQNSLFKAQRDRETPIANAAKQGFEQGRKDEKEEITRKLIQLGVADKIIIQSTGISPQELKKLRN